MSRLADYFVIVGYDHEKERSGVRSGKILQRFPETDWPDTPFIEGIEWFCQPLGWSLSTVRDEPKFFVSVLTDIDANRHYCACLCFNETVAITPNKPIDEEEETETLSRPSQATAVPAANVATITHHSIMYAPKCLVLVSRLDYTETFRNCLGTIYTVYCESLNYPLETLIGNILGCIQVPPPGGPQVRFSIGAGDKQALQPPQSPTIPVTGTCVDFLFQQLGIKNVMLLFCSVMTEQKILFHSKSYSRLTDSCKALVALMYPFRYSHVYIPILPASLIEVLSTPTPFIMGVHSSLQSEIQDMYLQDVIVADIDGGAIDIPAQIVPPVAQLPESLWDSVQQQLTMVLQPELQVSDYAFPSAAATAGTTGHTDSSSLNLSPYNGGGATGGISNGTLSSLHASNSSLASTSGNLSLSPAVGPRGSAMRDKEIRAVFMRMFAILLQGYRSCLTLIRIHPKPVIEFHKASFLGARDMLECDFLSRVLDSMFFTGFVQERGPPWRPCDSWDELYSAMNEMLRTEQQQERLLMTHIKELAQILFSNENPPTQQTYQQRVLRPTEGAFARIHQPTMPKIDGNVVAGIIREGIAKNDLPSRFHQMRQQPRIVPMGPHLQVSGIRPVINNTARRLEVLRTCVNCIFENKIADARKSFPAVLRMMNQRDARLALCRELAKGVHGNKSMLDNQQFHLVTALMNRALREDAAIGEHCVAAALLPLATAFCRKLCTGVIQFVYTAIQNHPVWKNQQFWEAAFYQDVQMQIKALYMQRAPNSSPGGGSLSGDFSWSMGGTMGRMSGSPGSGSSSLLVSRSQEPSALEIAAEQMRVWPTLDVGKQSEYVASEESTLYSQTIHYANRMVSLLIPPDVNSGGKVQKDHHHHGPSGSHLHPEGGGGAGGGVDETRSVSNSVVESQRSHSEEHNSDEGFDECDPGETGNAVAKMVSRFIDKVCTEGSVTAEHVRNLHAMVPGVIHMHIETLDAVHREMKRVPPVQKPKIQSPALLPGEVLLEEPMRTYLVSDGRGEDVGSNYFPAEGALFLTNYRVIFKGSPCDELTCEQSVVRAFPVASLTKEKRLTTLFLPHLGQNMPEGLQLRSSTFQLIKIAFDEEVSVETIESFRKLIGRCRYPADEFGFFAFAMAQGMVIPAPMHKVKEKNATLKGFAKKTLLRTAKKAGFKQKGTTKRKYILSGIEDVDENSLSGGAGGTGENLEEDDGSDDGTETMPRVTVKDVDRLKERSYVKDWQRIGLGDPQGTGYRISTVNCNYSLCRSYPAILVAPSGISDEQLRGLSRCYKNQRLPVATWRHRNGAVLLRGAVPHAKGVIGMLKGHPNNTERESSGSHAEQDRYFMCIIQTMPDTMTVNRSWGLSDSSLSINSLMLAAAEDPYLSLQHQLMTPDSSSARKGNVFQAKPGNYGTYDPHSKAAAQLKQNSKWGSLRAMPVGSGQRQREEEQLDLNAQSSQYWFQRVPLLIIGEKNQSKSVRLSENLAKFIAVDYTDVRHSRLAFKKLMRACLPSVVSTEPEQTFACLLEQSDWLQQIRGLLQLAGAIVDLMDCQGSSVTLALEDGWDVTAQISALAQLCLDPYYRTIEGFRVLIEKEWLAFGHRFGHRSNLRPNSSSGSPFAPTFLQFLDAVHQIWVQFPLAFEFNDYYLRFLAYHCVSCRFRTFLFDCELERFDLGIAAVDDKRGSLTSAHKNVVDAGAGSDDESIYPGGLRTSAANSSQTAKLGHSVFDYIERQHLKSPIFYNFMYVTDLENRVLRPQSSLAILELWEYYVDEELAHGQAYDPELVANDSLEDEEDEIVDEEHHGQKCPKNKVVTIGYDSLAKSIPDAFTRLLEELKVGESERGLLPQKWKQIWDKLELPHSDSLTRNASFSSALVRSHGRLLHKRSTLEILMRGRLSGHHQESFSHPHRFEKYVFTTLTNCNHCGSLLWGPIGDGRRCIDCGNAYHEKCADSVPKNCTKYKAVEGGVQQTLTRSQGDNGSMSSGATTGHGSKHFYYEQFSSNVAENRTHEGHLYKRGALLKGWKQRWFVLDSIKHQLRYYDAMEDSNYKGLIDLAEVQSVTQGAAVPVGTKKVDEKAFFDLKTSRRVYNFYAGSAVKAQEWIEKIQACLQ